MATADGAEMKPAQALAGLLARYCRVMKKKFLESRDDPDSAWAQASTYATHLTQDPKFAGWTVSVSKIQTPAGEAYGIYLFPPSAENA